MKKTTVKITLTNLRDALIMDLKKIHDKELDRARKGGYTKLSTLLMEFGSDKTIKMFDRFEDQVMTKAPAPGRGKKK